MGQIKDLTEKTSVSDNDVFGGDDSIDSYKSKKYKFSTMFSSFVSKIGATAVEIARVCSGNTATAAEISQICHGRVAGGGGINDLITAGATQLMISKGLTFPKFNGDTAEMVCLSSQINTLQYTTGTGRVNEVQQGLAVGNSMITNPGSYGYHGLVYINLSSNDSIAFGPVSSFNPSEMVMIRNISASTTVTIDRLGSDRFWYDGTGFATITLTAGDAIALMAVGSNGWMVLGKTAVTLT